MSRTNIRRTVLGAVAACVTTVALAASPANAATGCSGSGCDGKDPERTRCAADATTVDAETDPYYGTFELRRSARCDTFWIRLTNFPGASSHIDFDLYRWSPYKYVRTEVPPTPGRHWSDMLHATTGCIEGRTTINDPTDQPGPPDFGPILTHGRC